MSDTTTTEKTALEHVIEFASNKDTSISDAIITSAICLIMRYAVITDLIERDNVMVMPVHVTQYVAHCQYDAELHAISGHSADACRALISNFEKRHLEELLGSPYTPARVATVMSGRWKLIINNNAVEWDSGKVITHVRDFPPELVDTCFRMVGIATHTAEDDLAVFFADYPVSPPLLIPRDAVVETCAQELHHLEKFELNIKCVQDIHTVAVIECLIENSMGWLCRLSANDTRIVLEIMRGLGVTAEVPSH